MVNKKYLWQHPSGRWYFRRKCQYSLIDALPQTQEFDRIYWEIMTGKAVAAKTSWNALIDNYRTSDRWTGLKPRTRSDYEKVMEYLRDKIGKRDVKALTRAVVIEAQKANAHRTRFANYIPQMLVVLCEHAIDLGWLQHNPAKGIRALRTPEGRKKPHIPWPDWAVDKFRAEASPLARFIFEIGIGSAQRPADWVKFSWGDYDGESLKVVQGKTDKGLTLPCSPPLKAALDGANRALGATPIAARRILTQPNGNAMTYR